jgi:hypothetical protein
MQVLNSGWLIKMLEKAGKTPEARILSLFEILADWSAAPHFKEHFLVELNDATEPTLLLEYLHQQAQQTKAAAPKMLAEQIVLLAKISLSSQLTTNNSDALQHAKETAKALIKAQCEKERTPFKDYFRLDKQRACIGVAFTAIILIVGGAVLFKQKPEDSFNQANIQADAHLNDQVTSDPKLTADMYASLETMRGGDCRFIEALMIPEADKKVYVENVVGGQVPATLHDQMIAQRYIQKIRCNYTPMLMQNSTN